MSDGEKEPFNGAGAPEAYPGGSDDAGAPGAHSEGTDGAVAQDKYPGETDGARAQDKYPGETDGAGVQGEYSGETGGNEEAEESSVSGRGARKLEEGNAYFRRMFDTNYLEYAAYAIKDRAIPNVDDGLKPVQRRILWVMHKMDDGRTHKAANVVGEVMGKYHPHGDASIGGALVVLANKEYFIEKQGNFGNIFTGSSAAAARYIECGLSKLGREVLFNDAITELVDTYDGRNLEPVSLPVKIPALLMLGSDGIAVGMATKILPHNFRELLEAQISELNGVEFHLYPDFLQGGLMDVSNYADGNGKIILRAKIEIRDNRLYIREIPATTTTESLISSIEAAAEKGKIKIKSVSDYTAKDVEIEVVPTRGYDPEKCMKALYMYTDCSVSISPNLTVIRDNRPAVMSVTEVVKRNTEKLLHYLKRELELELEKQAELFHAKTLAQIFFENRIYKRIEECESEEDEYKEVHAGLAPFRAQLRRDVTNEDVDKLLALPVRRISRFDIEKNQRELREIDRKMAELRKHLGDLKGYAISYLRELLEKYGKMFPRRTEIEKLEKIDRKAAALSNIKVYWDRKNFYIGTGVKSDNFVLVSEFDQLLCVERNGLYRIVNIPEKMFIDRLYEFRKQDAETEFGVVYRDRKSGKLYGKRTRIAKFVTEREYRLIPAGARLEIFTPCPNSIYAVKYENNKPDGEFNLMDMPCRSPKARGVLIGAKIAKMTFLRNLTEEELAEALRRQDAEPEPVDDESEATETQEAPHVPGTADARETKPGVRKTAAETREAPTDAPETEPDAPETEPGAGAPTAERRPRRREPAEAPATASNHQEAPATGAGAEKDDDNKDEDFGIVQPEFGF